MSASPAPVYDWNALDAAGRDAVLARPVQAVAQRTRDAVAGLLADVQARGDVALREVTARFDGVELAAFEVGEEEFAAAHTAVPAALRQAMQEAAERIEAFHRAGMAQPYAVETAPGVVCERMIRPIPRVGLYVPAGSAPLPSTALMLGVPARLAGCREVVLCTPPRRDGSADPAVLVAAQLTGVRRVFKLGGAQAIAAMAFGTDSVPKCDKLFGPGNSYVTEAKQQVAQAGAAAIDMPAGPSEVLVIADAGADAAFVAADLLSQAEHGPDSQVLLLSDDDALIARVQDELATQLARLDRADIAQQALSASRLVKVATLDDAFAISNRYAPEHLILALREPRARLDKVEAAGSVFLGDFTPEALGDYCSGTNHVLPTGGAARAYSGVSVASFQNFVSVQSAGAR
jgi:histidinol dehydrogenase